MGAFIKISKNYLLLKLLTSCDRGLKLPKFKFNIEGSALAMARGCSTTYVKDEHKCKEKDMKQRY